MNRLMKSKERKAMQACRDHKLLQARFTHQENFLQAIQYENRCLHQRIRQYERCLDDIMRKVVDAIVAEDSLREEVTLLKTRVRDLEAQNALLTGSPAKGRGDEGYCTMSSGQPQPSNSHLEDLPEEPEQLFNSEEPSCVEVEDWSMSQEELAVIGTENELSEKDDWEWTGNDYINSTMIDAQAEGIAQLLKETIIYSEDEEIPCKEFTKDFYKLVNIPFGSTKSLFSHRDAETDDEDETSSNSSAKDDRPNDISLTASEAGLAQVISCSSSDSGDQTLTISPPPLPLESPNTLPDSEPKSLVKKKIEKFESEASTLSTDKDQSWRRSKGWKRVPRTSDLKQQRDKSPEPLSLPPLQSFIPVARKESKIPPPVPVRCSYAS